MRILIALLLFLSAAARAATPPTDIVPNQTNPGRLGENTNAFVQIWGTNCYAMHYYYHNGVELISFTGGPYLGLHAKADTAGTADTALAGWPTTWTLNSATFANQGTATTVLHGNASGNPSWSAVNLGTDVTGSLPAGSISGAPWLTAPVDNASLANSSVTYNGKTVALGSSATLGLASADFANQGTTTTVLHGNAAGNPSFASVNLLNDTAAGGGTAGQYLTNNGSGGVGWSVAPSGGGGGGGSGNATNIFPLVYALTLVTNGVGNAASGPTNCVVDLSKGNSFSLALNGTNAYFSQLPINATPMQPFTIEVTQGTGAHMGTVTFNTNYWLPPTYGQILTSPTNTAGSVQIISCIMSSAGTTNRLWQTLFP